MKNFDAVEGAGWTVLTARERDVIHPVAEGKSNKLIAMELGISMRTVEAHRARIFYKMQCSSLGRYVLTPNLTYPFMSPMTVLLTCMTAI